MGSYVSREKAIDLFSKILSKIESNPCEEKWQNLDHAKIVQKFRSLRCPFMVELLVLAGFTRIHDRLRLTNNNVAFVSQKLAAKIEAHEAELKRHFILCVNKQRLFAVKKEVPTKDYQQKLKQRKQLWKQQMQRQLRNKEEHLHREQMLLAKQGFFDE